MKVVFVLLLSGFSYVVASPACSEEEVNRCIKSHKRLGVYLEIGSVILPETAAKLDVFCKDVLDEFKCQVDLADRCPNTLIATFREVLVDYKSFFGRICDRNDPLRQKCLDNVSCLNKETKPAEAKCLEPEIELKYCERYTGILNCFKSEIINKCGNDIEELVTLFLKPKHASKTVFCG